jgi:hypothetical protein
MSDSNSYITGFTSKTKTGAINKHCMMDKCNSKRISGINWSTHVKKVHKGFLGNKEGRDYVKCAGAGCNACAKGKYSILLLLLLASYSYFWPLTLTFGLLLLASYSYFWPLTFGLLLLASYLRLLFMASILTLLGNQGYNGDRPSYVCGQCGTPKRYDQFPKDSKKVCLVCLVGGKSQVGMIAPQLNKRNLSQLPTRTESSSHLIASLKLVLGRDYTLKLLLLLVTKSNSHH